MLRQSDTQKCDQHPRAAWCRQSDQLRTLAEALPNHLRMGSMACAGEEEEEEEVADGVENSDEASKNEAN